MSSSCQGKLQLWYTLSESVKQQNKRAAPPVSLLQAEVLWKFNYLPAATSLTSNGNSKAASSFQELQGMLWSKISSSKHRVSALFKLSRCPHYHSIGAHLCLGIQLIEKSHHLSMLHFSRVPRRSALLLGKQKVITYLMSRRCVTSPSCNCSVNRI